MENFKSKIAEILEVDSVNDTDVLTDFDNWDSLSSLSIIAMIDTDYSLNMSAEKLVSFNTVGELEQFVKANGK